MVKERDCRFVVLEPRPWVGSEKSHTRSGVGELRRERLDARRSCQTKRGRAELAVELADATLADDGDARAARDRRRHVFPAVRVCAPENRLDLETDPRGFEHPSLVSPKRTAQTIRSRAV